MVNLMLQSDGEEVFGLQRDLVLIRGPSFYLDFCCTLYFGSVINHAEATFLPNNLALTGCDDRIDQFEQMLARFFVIYVDDNDALRDTDLHRGQTDTRRVVHGEHQVIDQMDKIAGNVLDRSPGLFETRVGKVEDFSDHCYDL